VLYRGERYSRLSDADIARLKATLGFDPTTKDRMERAARASDAPWNLVIIIAVAIVGIFVLVHKSMQLVRWISRLATISAVAGSQRQEEEEDTPDPLEVRKKQLMNRQWSDSQTDHAAPIPAASSVHASAPGAAPVRTFGRRSARSVRNP
jgi:protein-S-isoprenylcysteine O-methyltransferase Ste14